MGCRAWGVRCRDGVLAEEKLLHRGCVQGCRGLMVWRSGFRLQGSGCGVWDSGLGCRVQDFGLRVSGSGSRDWGLGLKVSGFG